MFVAIAALVVPFAATNASSNSVNGRVVASSGAVGTQLSYRQPTPTATPMPSGGLVNGGFETGNFTGWTRTGTTAIMASPVEAGLSAGRGGSTAVTNGDSSISQTFTVPASGGTLSFWYRVACPDTVAYDWATVTVRNGLEREVSRPLLP